MESDYISVSDAAQSIIAPLQKKTTHRVFNVGSAEGASVKQLVDL